MEYIFNFLMGAISTTNGYLSQLVMLYAGNYSRTDKPRVTVLVVSVFTYIAFCEPEKPRK